MNINNTSSQRQCKICGKIKDLTIDNFYLESSHKYGFGYTCRICKNERRLKGEFKKKTKIEQRINSYKTEDKRKNRDFNLSKEFIKDFISKNCFYCDYPSTGLDRIDNKIGHTKENCVPCCKECNIARNNNFSHEEMILIGKVVKQIKDNRNHNL